MSQNWLHENSIQNGSPAQKETRFSGSPSVSMCADFDKPIYRTDLGGLDRAANRRI